MKKNAINGVLVLVFTLLITLIWQRYFYQYPSLSEEQAIRQINWLDAKNSQQRAEWESHLISAGSSVTSSWKARGGNEGDKNTNKAIKVTPDTRRFWYEVQCAW
ncbi:hypothetical protein [Photobacterium kagoshimensis]|uniref:hypothetical protein n=1 Tax=Photobacterium kagoshimensis TaxID=2910242 RepID=UPI003D10BAB7